MFNLSLEDAAWVIVLKQERVLEGKVKAGVEVRSGRQGVGLEAGCTKLSC